MKSHIGDILKVVKIIFFETKALIVLGNLEFISSVAGGVHLNFRLEYGKSRSLFYHYSWSSKVVGGSIE